MPRLSAVGISSLQAGEDVNAHKISREEAKLVAGEVEERLRRAVVKADQVGALFAGSRLERISMGMELSGLHRGRRSSRRPLAHPLSPCWPCCHCRPSHCGLRYAVWPRQRCEQFDTNPLTRGRRGRGLQGVDQ